MLTRYIKSPKLPTIHKLVSSKISLTIDFSVSLLSIYERAFTPSFPYPSPPSASPLSSSLSQLPLASPSALPAYSPSSLCPLAHFPVLRIPSIQLRQPPLLPLRCLVFPLHPLQL